MKKAVTHLKLNQTNPGKLQKLDELAGEHQRVVQAYVNWLISHEIRQPNQSADLPQEAVSTPLSDRWQRCAWQQACGMVQSWYSNEQQNRPVLQKVCIQANTNVVVIKPSRSPHFDYWLRISTLEAGHPVRIPIPLYERAKETLTQFPKLCSGVMLNRRDGEWYATFVVERKGPKAKASQVVRVAIGMAVIVSTSEGQRYGQMSAELRRRVERSSEKRRRKRKLNTCLKRKNQPLVNLSDQRTGAFARNEIGQALNQMLDELPEGANVALERLSVKDMRMKSRQMNRALRASQLGYARDKLKFKLDERGLRYRSVQPAYSSQQCSQCGFTLPMNRRSQAVFRCLWCGFEANADENAARNIAERFGDAELNALSFREVETVLAIRFMRRLPVARSATAGLELQPILRLSRGKLVECRSEPSHSQLVTVNQPGQDPCLSCL